MATDDRNRHGVPDDESGAPDSAPFIVISAKPIDRDLVRDRSSASPKPSAGRRQGAAGLRLRPAIGSFD
jgi:hypothetical protein